MVPELGMRLKQVALRQGAQHRSQNGRCQISLQQLPSIAPERLIFFDESGASMQMTPRYARHPRGARVHESNPQGDWKIRTFLGAMNLRSLIAAMRIEAPTDAEIFRLTWITSLSSAAARRRGGGNRQPQITQRIRRTRTQSRLIEPYRVLLHRFPYFETSAFRPCSIGVISKLFMRP